MAVAFRAAGAAASGLGAVAPGAPAGNATNDIWLCVVQTSNENAAGVPTATNLTFVEVANSPQGIGTAATAGSVGLRVYWARQSASAPGTMSVPDSGNHTIAQVYAYSGCATSGNPWSATFGWTLGGTQTSIISPASATQFYGGSGTLVLAIAGHAVDSASAQFSAWTNPSSAFSGSLVEETGSDVSTTSGTGGGFAVADITITAAGSIAASTTIATVGSTSNQANMLIHLRPATVPWIYTLTAASLSFVGSITKKTIRSLTATLSFVGSTTKQTTRTLTAASLSFAGSVTRTYIFARSSLSGILNFTAGPSVVDSYSETNQDDSIAIDGSGAALHHTAGAQAFSVTNSRRTYSAKFYLSKFGTPTGNAVAKLYNLTGTFGTDAIPTGAALATSNNLDVSSLSSTYVLYELLFTGAPPVLVAGTKYCIALEYTGGDSSNFIRWGADVSSPSHAGNPSVQDSGAWSAFSTFDLCFYLYDSDQTLIIKKVNRVLTAALSFIGNFRYPWKATATLSFVGATTKKTLRKLIANLHFGAVDEYPGYVGLNSTQAMAADGNVSIGQTFLASRAGYLTVSGFNIQKQGSPTGNIFARLYNLTGTPGTNAVPTGAALATSDLIDVSTISSSIIKSPFPFIFSGANQYLLSAGTNYGIAVEVDGGSGLNLINVQQDSAALSVHSGNGFRFTGGSWLSQAQDTGFYVLVNDPLVRQTLKVLTGALSFSGVIARFIGYLLTGTISFSGAIPRSISYVFGSSLSFAGAITKKTLRALSGALSFIGSIATSFIPGSHNFTQALNGTLSFVGSTTNRTGKVLTAALSFVGSIVKQTRKSLSGTLASSGAITKLVGYLLSGAISFSGAIPRSISYVFGSTLSFVGSVVKQTNRLLSGALSFVGSVSKRTGKALSGSLAFVGAIARFVGYLLSGTLSFTGAIPRSISYVFGSSLSFIGSVTKKTSRTLTAALSFIGSFTAAEINVILFAAALNFTGAITKRTNKALSGALSFVGAITKFVGYLLSGTLSFTGAIPRSISYVFGSSLSFVGSVTKRTSRSLTASLGFAGSIAKQTNIPVFGVLSFIGSAIKSCARSLTSTLSFIGSTTKRTSRTLAATLSFIGSLTASEINVILFTAALNFTGAITKRTNKSLSGILSFVGNVNRFCTRSLAATLNFVGNLTKQIQRTLTGVLSFIGNLATQMFHGGTTFFQSLAGTLNFVGSVTKQTMRNVSGSSSFVGSVVKQANRTLSGVESFIGACGHSTSRSISAILSFAGSLTKRVARLLSGAISFIGDMTSRELITLLLTASLSFVGSMTKRTSRTLTGILDFTGLITKLTRRAFSGVLNASAACVHYTQRTVGGTLSFIGSLTTAQVILMLFTAALSFAGNLQKRTGKSLSGAAGLAGVISKAIYKNLSATLGPIGQLIRNVSMALYGTISFIGDFTGSLVSHAFYVLIESTLILTGGINRSIFRPMIALLSISGEFTKMTSRSLESTLSFLHKFISWASFNKIWSVQIPNPPIFTAQVILSPASITAKVLKGIT